MDQLLNALGSPLLLVLQPGERIYWGYVLSAAALAAGLAWWRPALAAGGLRALLRGSTWRHPSSVLDVKLLVGKHVARALWAGPVVVSSYAVALATARGLEGLVAPPSTEGWPTWLVRVLYSALLFVAWDLSRYLLHRALHEWPTLWALHKVHHSAEVLTPLTLYRTHPIESALFHLRGVVVTGVLAGVFFFAFRGRAVELEILGIHALGFVFNFAGANLRHSTVWLTFGRRAERWVLSPAQHQLHHSRDPAHHGTNYGTWLALWDRLGGSLLVAPPSPPPLAFGLAPGAHNHAEGTLRAALWGPLREAARRCGGYQRVLGR